MRVFNFSAGPAMLPAEVMTKAQAEFTNYRESGSGIIELSHRGPEFTEIIERAVANISELLNLPEEYSVCFIQGGASMQFAMIPMNFMRPGGFAEYLDTGSWSAKAIKEARGFGEVVVAASSKDGGYREIPNLDGLSLSPDASYVHITSNNTIAGTQYHDFPTTETPLIADMSSDILSRAIDIKKFGMIYAGAQKNLGPSGVAVLVLRNDLAERTAASVPTMLRYGTYIEKKSLFNTPPTFAIYLVALVTDWIKKQGGLVAVEAANDAKAKALYDVLDSSGFYRCPIADASRSKMNVVFRLPTEELEAAFISKAKSAGMTGLKGHRSVGGIRASIYNAMPAEGVERLIEFMKEFEKDNG